MTNSIRFPFPVWMLHGRVEEGEDGGPVFGSLLPGIHGGRRSPTAAREDCALPKVTQPEFWPDEAPRMEEQLPTLLAITKEEEKTAYARVLKKWFYATALFQLYRKLFKGLLQKISPTMWTSDKSFNLLIWKFRELLLTSPQNIQLDLKWFFSTEQLLALICKTFRYLFTIVLFKGGRILIMRLPSWIWILNLECFNQQLFQASGIKDVEALK